MSSEVILISIISALLVIIQTLVAYIYTTAIKELNKRLDRQDARHDIYVKEKGDFDYKFRHDEYAQRVQQIELRLGQLERLPPRFEQLWSRIFNGGHK